MILENYEARITIYLTIQKKNVQPDLQKRGFNIQAFIISDDLITANVTKKLVEVLDSLKGKVKLFTNIDDAKMWVVEMIEA